MNIFDFAAKMELDGKSYYEEMAEATSVRALKSLLMMLANDEQKHFEIVLAMKRGGDLTMADSAVLDEAKNVFDIFRADKSILEGLEKEHDICKHSIKIEEESIRLYEDMAARENNPHISQLLLRIANEEKKHYNIMENFYEFILRPEYYLEWREFGNLGRL